MALTSTSTHGSIIKAVQGDTIPGQHFKALMWVLSGATINTHKLEVTEEDTNGHVVYADAAPKTDGAVPIPCPAGPVDDLFVKDMDNGYLLAYPAGYLGSLGTFT